MTRLVYGGTVADFGVSVIGGGLIAAPGSTATGTVWSAQSGGTQVTDLEDMSNNARTNVSLASGPWFQFQGADSAGAQAAYWNVPLWIDFGTGQRLKIQPQQIAQSSELLTTFVAASTSGPLAYAENISALTTAAPTGGTTVPGCVITIPATAGDVWIEFGADIGISTAGQGNGGVSIAEWTGGTFPAGPLDWSLHHFSSADPVTANGPTVRGSYHLGPTTTDRVFAVGTQTNEEGSALATYTRNGASTNKTYGRTWIAAYTR